MFENSPTRCRLDLPQDLPARALPPDFRHNIFLIVKEALTNVLKHAAAREVQLSARVAGKKLSLVIADDGRGFDFNAVTTNGARNGLENMRRRAEAVGGRLNVTSAPGRGARVEFGVDFPG
jgi:signal transduction histidine kinase